MPSRTIARNLTTASSGVRVSAQRRGREFGQQFAGAVLDEAGLQVEAGEGFRGEERGGAQVLDDPADFQDRVDAERPGGHQPVVLQVPDHGAVGADDRAGVAELFLERVQPARRAAGDKNELDAGVPAGVEGPDGAVADLSVVPKNRSVNITCYQPHPASLRALAAARRRRTLLLEVAPRRFLTPGYVLLSVRDVR